MRISRTANSTLATLAAALIFTPNTAWANAALPLVFISMTHMCLALVPIILIEAAVFQKSLSLKFKEALGSAFVANVFSTFIGIPVAGLVLLIATGLTGADKTYELESLTDKILAVTWQAPWLIQYFHKYNYEQFSWMFNAAQIFLLLPFFFASWASEYFILKRTRHIETNAHTLKISCLKTNAASYLLLALYLASKFRF